jgi:hypothetical protein
VRISFHVYFSRKFYLYFLYPNIFHQLSKSPGILCYAKHCCEWVFEMVTNEVACLYLKLQFMIKKK